MDFSAAGIKEAIVRAIKVGVYVALSGAVYALIQYMQGVHVDATNFALVGLVGAINMGLAFLQKWLSTKAPVEVG